MIKRFAFVLRYSSIFVCKKFCISSQLAQEVQVDPCKVEDHHSLCGRQGNPIQSWKQKVEVPHKSEELTGFTSSSPSAPASARRGVGLDLEEKVDKVANSPNQPGLCTLWCWLVRTTCEVTRQQKDSVTLQALVVWQKSNHFVSTLCSHRNCSLGSLVYIATNWSLTISRFPALTKHLGFHFVCAFPKTSQ